MKCIDMSNHKECVKFSYDTEKKTSDRYYCNTIEYGNELKYFRHTKTLSQSLMKIIK